MLGVPKWYTGICAPSQPQPAGQTTSTEALAAEQSFPKGQTWFAHSCALCNHSVKKPGKKLTETPALPAHVAGAYEAVAWSSSPTAAQLSDFHKQDVTWCANGHAFHWSCALDQLTGDATQACPVCDLPPTPELHAEFSKMADNSRRMSRVDVIRQTLLSRGKYEGGGRPRRWRPSALTSRRGRQPVRRRRNVPAADGPRAHGAATNAAVVETVAGREVLAVCPWLPL